MSADRFILRRCRDLDLSVDPGHPTKFTRHLQFLPLTYLQDYC